MPATLPINLSDASPDAIRQVWIEILEEAKQDGSEAREYLDRYGFDPDSLADATSVDVEEKERDFGLILLVTVGGPVTVHILNSLWDDLVRPRLRKRFKVDGGDAVS